MGREDEEAIPGAMPSEITDRFHRTKVTVDQLSELTLLIVSLLETLNATLRFCEDKT